jgi:GT2 family glycosyltransferase
MARDWPIVSVGIVTWNSERHMPTCLDGLDRQRYPNLELTAVDNGSVDRSVEVIRHHWPAARVIENGTNEGYCRAHNAAIRASRGEYYLALSPDVRLEPGFLERLVLAMLADPARGSAMSKLLSPSSGDPPIIDAAGLMMDRRRHQYLRGHGEPDRGQYDTAEEVFGADGAAPLYRRSMLEEVKIEGQYFDEQFFAYMDDVDLAWRARLFGWRCWYEPAAVATHVRTFQPGRRRERPRAMRRTAVKNRYLMLLKNEGREEFRRDWWRVLAFDLGIWAYILLVEQSSLGALALLRRQWERGRAWRSEIWGRVTATPEDRLRWFG